MIFSGMKDENYFDKFVEDLARREELHRERQRTLTLAQEMWEKRQQLDRQYREHPHQRIRYSK